MVLYRVQPIIDYIDEQFNAYNNLETTKSARQKINDTRIHCCVYLLSPSGILNEFDVHTMKLLAKKVNLIPVPFQFPNE